MPKFICATLMTNISSAILKRKKQIWKWKLLFLRCWRTLRVDNIISHGYWYMLKYFVRSLHVVYRLLYKLLLIYGNSSVRTKLKCHNLIGRPRTIHVNMCLFRELVTFTQIQTQLVASQVRFNLNPVFQDTVSRPFFLD